MFITGVTLELPHTRQVFRWTRCIEILLGGKDASADVKDSGLTGTGYSESFHVQEIAVATYLDQTASYEESRVSGVID
jgi:hypothetical protein